MNRKKYIFLSLFFTLMAILLTFNIFSPKREISNYYEKIKDQEFVDNTTIITENDIKIIRECKNNKKLSNDDCLRSFYKNYTINRGIEKAFSHLALLQKDYPETLSGCHYISHGIGHGSLILNKGNIYKAFNIMQDSNYFKNVTTCGNGYYHGLMEELTKNEFSKEGVLNKIKPVCGDPRVTQSCYHGVGHAAAVQLNNNIRDSLYVCDNLTEDKVLRFECHTGVFMEVMKPKNVKVDKGIATFPVCDSFERPYKEACYMEQTSMMELFSKDNKDYVKNIGFCKQIQDDKDRMSCIKVNAIRSVRIVRFEDIKSMCNNTSSKYERVLCTAIAASRVSGSIDKNSDKSFRRDAARDVCSTLNLVEMVHCLTYIYDLREQLFYISDNDFTFPKITFERIKRVL